MKPLVNISGLRPDSRHSPPDRGALLRPSTKNAANWSGPEARLNQACKTLTPMTSTARVCSSLISRGCNWRLKITPQPSIHCDTPPVCALQTGTSTYSSEKHCLRRASTLVRLRRSLARQNTSLRMRPYGMRWGRHSKAPGMQPQRLRHCSAHRHPGCNPKSFPRRPAR